MLWMCVLRIATNGSSIVTGGNDGVTRSQVLYYYLNRDLESRTFAVEDRSDTGHICQIQANSSVLF